MPWHELAGLQERLSKLLEEALLGGGEVRGGALSASWRPLVDLLETQDAYVLYAELPGVQRPDVTLTSDGRVVELAGMRRLPEHGFLRLEGTWGAFRRKLELPGPVATDRIEARFRRGILEVVLPKERAEERAEERPGGEGIAVPLREGV
jgi:HSP20 family protein